MEYFTTSYRDQNYLKSLNAFIKDENKKWILQQTYRNVFLW